MRSLVGLIFCELRKRQYDESPKCHEPSGHVYYLCHTPTICCFCICDTMFDISEHTGYKVVPELPNRWHFGFYVLLVHGRNQKVVKWNQMPSSGHIHQSLYVCGAQKHLTYYFGDISQTKAIFRNYLTEKCWSKFNWQLSFKYFVINFKLTIRIIRGPDNTCKEDLQGWKG